MIVKEIRADIIEHFFPKFARIGPSILLEFSN